MMKKAQKNIFDFLSSKIDQDFEKFDSTHPVVYQKFREHALHLISKGITRYSADAILHVIRFDAAIKKDIAYMYKINNNFSSRYARKFIEQHPNHSGFFETRVLKPL